MCGIVGIIGTEQVFTKIYRAAGKLQHRGTDGIGVVFSDGARFIEPAPHRVLGEAPQSQNSWPGERPEHARLGLLHIRYGTSGKRKNFANIQPFMVASPRYGTFCLAHNGDTQEVDPLRERLEKERSAAFTSTSDSEVLMHLIAAGDEESLAGAISPALHNVKSAYTLVLATPDSLIAARDIYDYRPLSIGRFQDGGYIVASETCAFEVIGAEHVRTVLPGETVSIDKDGIHVVHRAAPAQPLARCIFELVYFSDPASETFGVEASMFRHLMGRQLAREYVAARGALSKDDIIIPIPNSAYHYAEGFSHESWHPLTFPVSRINRSARSFIGSDDADRILRVLLKSNIGQWSVRGKRCFLIDDSLVRGNTMRAMVGLFRKHGAASISVLIGSPPILFPCRYGIDFKKPEELIARKHGCDIDAIRKEIGADDLLYLSRDGFYKVVREVAGDTEDFCFACFNGEYAL